MRRSLSLVIVQMLGGHQAPIRAVTVGPRLELAIMQLFSPRGRESDRSLEPEQLTAALDRLQQISRTPGEDGRILPLITPPSLRVGIRRLVQPVLPRLPVISLAELPPQTPVQTVAVWELADAA